MTSPKLTIRPFPPIDWAPQENPFRVDRVLAGGSPLALEERADPPVAIGWPLVDEATDIGGQFDIAGPDLWSPCRASALLTFDDIVGQHLAYQRPSSRGISRYRRARQQGRFFCPCEVERLL